MNPWRPRTNCPSDEELIELGNDLMKWASEPTEEKRTSFQFWYAIEHGITYEQWKLMKQKESFRPYYERARAFLSQKLHKDELEKGMAHRYIRMYDRELCDEENEDKIFESNLKKEQIDRAGERLTPEQANEIINQKPAKNK